PVGAIADFCASAQTIRGYVGSRRHTILGEKPTSTRRDLSHGRQPARVRAS
ncbi:MAG: hypothetical protein QOH53_1766, partial [Ilumatobacteraceae bacterium]